jgi:dihydrofolate reductase
VQIARTRSFYQRADLHIMGRNLYQGAAEYFPTAVDHPYGDVMNAARKMVFTRTLQTVGWANSTIIRGDLAEEIKGLKRDGAGDIIAHGGLGFWQSLIRLDLIDEYRVTVFSFLAGKGRRLFEDLDEPRQLELASSAAFSNGTVELEYRRRR